MSEPVPHALDCNAGRYRFLEAKLTDGEKRKNLQNSENVTNIVPVIRPDRKERRALRIERRDDERRIYADLRTRYAAIADTKEIFNPGRE